MKCKTPACAAPPLHGARYCVSCLPGVLKARKEKKLAWWRGYYERVRRVKRGHVKRYQKKGEGQ